MAQVDVIAEIDRARFRGLPLLVSALTLLAMVFDGFDIQLIGFVAPRLISEWGVAKQALSPVLAAGLVGMALGGLAIGQIGDRYGRRVALLLSLSIIAVMSYATAQAESLQALAAWRFLTGLGLGGVVPNCTALMLEYAPRAVRQVVVALTVVGVPLGGVLGAEIAARIIPAYGWRVAFVVGAILPALIAIAIYVLLPESPRFLVRRGGYAGVLSGLMNRISGTGRFSPQDQFLISEGESPGARAGVTALFAPAWRRDTAVIWLGMATNIFAVYAFFSWLPTVLSVAGMPLEIALRGALLFNLGGVVAAILLALLIARLGSRRVMIPTCVIAIGSSLFMGYAGDAGYPVSVLLAIMTLAGASILGLQVALYAVAAHAYPTELRSTGVGWASSFARLGAILSSFGGGILLAMGQGMRPFFVGVATVLLLTLAAVVLLRRHIKPEIF